MKTPGLWRGIKAYSVFSMTYITYCRPKCFPMSHWYLSTLAPADRESARAHRQTRQVKNAMQESDLRLSPEFRPALVNLEKLACGRFSDITPLTAGKKRGFCRLRRRSTRKSDRLLACREPLRFLAALAHRTAESDGGRAHAPARSGLGGRSRASSVLPVLKEPVRLMLAQAPLPAVS